ncbi:MAG: DinB family protein [Bacteroidota bacterium]
MNLKVAASDLLDQLEGIIDQISNDDFKKPLEILSDSSIGQHVRHTLEFFICLMDASNEGIINYDKRKHDKYIQEDKALAVSVIKSIKEFIAKVEDNKSLSLEMEYGVSDTEVETSVVPTNYERELAYNIEHAVHHMALMKVGIISRLNYVELPPYFGVASSTVRYKNQ